MVDYTDEQERWVSEYKHRLGIDPMMDMFESGECPFSDAVKMNCDMVRDDVNYLDQLGCSSECENKRREDGK